MEKEVKRRARSIADLELTDSIEEIIEKAELHPDSKTLVEQILKIKREKKVLSQQIDSIGPYKKEKERMQKEI